MKALHERFGKLPYMYVALSALNDYQVTIEGPSGRAIITDVNLGQDFNIETMFYGQARREYPAHGLPSEAAPEMLVRYLVHLNNTHLANRGVAIPPLTNPRTKALRYAVYLVLGVLLVGLLAWGAVTALAPTDDVKPIPSNSFTVAPGGTR